MNSARGLEASASKSGTDNHISIQLTCEKPQWTTYLCNSIVGRVDRLQTFFTRYSHADIGSLNHADVVRPVANCQRHRTNAFFDQFDNERLLQRRYAATNDSLALDGQAEQQTLAVIVRKCLLEDKKVCK